ncbi:MAG TPA: PAS domain S-box protein [Candidatus Acidoferrales bacterium]|nr:PAS domain S-box protein [Candidatus Acidoferrales bacterium]
MKQPNPFPPTPDFQSLFQSAPDLYLVLNPDLTIVAVSDAYLRATLTKREEILGRGIFDVFPDNPADLEATGVRNLRTSLERVLQFKMPDAMAVQKYDIRKPEAEGGGFEERHWSPVNHPVLGPDREVRYIIHSVKDVTEIVRLKEQGIDQQKLVDELRSEERFRKAFNANPEPITIATIAEGRYIDVNESFLQVTGYRREEVIGRTSLDLKFWERPEDRARLVELLSKQGSVRDVEISFRTKSGEIRTGLDSGETIEVAGQKCVFAIFKDITEQKILEKQLRQAQKMEAIGQLAGGIAHDFNNLLGVIIGYCEILEDQLPANSSLLKECEQIRKAGERAASLTRQLLAFSRQQILEPRVMDLNAAVLDMEKMLRRLIGEDVDLSTSLDPSLGSVKADRGQIEQVIMNLVVNARDAMPEGGRLAIETSNVELDEDYVRRHPQQQSGAHVLLSVSDTGIGMSAETQARIFDPFFTTKELGKGTGLGLSTVYGVVRQSGGHIWVYSELGLGTTFKIYLPRVDAAAIAEKPSATVTKPSLGAKTILLVEDEEQLRMLTHRFLTETGYTVLEAEHPEKAIQIAQRHRGPIDLLLTDVVMPGMNGRALAEKLAQYRPSMRAVYMSGYTGFAHSELLESGANLLPKPFTRESLLRKLNEVLTSESAVETK